MLVGSYKIADEKFKLFLNNGSVTVEHYYQKQRSGTYPLSSRSWELLGKEARLDELRIIVARLLSSHLLSISKKHEIKFVKIPSSYSRAASSSEPSTPQHDLQFAQSTAQKTDFASRSTIGQLKAKPPEKLDKQISSLVEPFRPPLYPYEDLLARSWRGTEYQLLVLLHEMIKLMLNKLPFEAAVEMKGCGNLDDIVLKKYRDSPSKQNQELTEIDAYQVKYYNHPLKVHDFFNQEDNANKQVVMHIGKFFNGWLGFRKDYPNLPKANLHCIIYTNAPLDETLNQSIDENGKWRKSFVSQASKIHFRFSTSSIQVHKNTFYGICNQGLSEEIWNQLHTKNYINSKGEFTSDPHSNIDGIFVTIQRGRKNTRKQKMTLEMWNQVRDKLYKLYNDHASGSVDLYKLLYDQAWKYQEKKRNIETLTLSEAKKQKRFRKFLKSMQFKINQPNIDTLERRIQQNLSNYCGTQGAEMFLCLYYSVRAWFRQEALSKQKRALNPHLIDQLIKESQMSGPIWHELQGHTRAVLGRMSYEIEGKHVESQELHDLREAMKTSGVVILVGEKGMGKSGLIKFALSAPAPASAYHHESYLVFSASDLLDSSDKLKQDATRVLKKLACINKVVIDAAEFLVDMAESDLKEMFSEFCTRNRCVILTITPDSLSFVRRHLPAGTSITHIEIGPLSQDAVFATFPILKHNEALRPLMHSARQPFYLSAIMRLINHTDDQTIEHMITHQSRQSSESKLIWLVIEGNNKKLTKQRRLAAKWLARQISQLPPNEHKVKLSPDFSSRQACIHMGLELLIQDNIVIQERETVRFSHDLYYDHALIAFLQFSWKHYQLKGSIYKFWNKLASIMQRANAHLILYKWHTLYNKQVNASIIQSIDVLKGCNYCDRIKIMPIASHDKELFEYFINTGILDIKKGTQIILSTILHNYAEGLEILLDKNPKAAHHPEIKLVLNNGQRIYLSKPSLSIHNEDSGTSSSTSHSDNVEDGFAEDRSPSDTSPNISEDDESSTSHSDEIEDESAGDRSSSDTSTHTTEDDESSSYDPDYIPGGYWRNSKDSQNLRSAPPSDDEREASREFDQIANADLRKENIASFVSQVRKYWSAGFDEPASVSDEDYDSDFGVYLRTTIRNPKYRERPNLDLIYLHKAVSLNAVDCLQVLVDFYNQQRSYFYKRQESYLDKGHSIYQWFRFINECEETPLHIAALHHSLEAAELLLDQGESNLVDGSDMWGETPLHNAAYENDIELSRLLLEYGANPNHRNKFGLSPLHIAIAKLNIRLVKLLLKHGADLSQRTFIDDYEDEGLNTADLLDELYKEAQNSLEKKEIEEKIEIFVIELIKILNFGIDDADFVWGTSLPDYKDDEMRLSQLNEVPELMTMIEHRAQLSKEHKGFDYFDDASEFDYAIKRKDLERIKYLSDFILQEDRHMQRVFSGRFSKTEKKEIIESWCRYTDFYENDRGQRLVIPERIEAYAKAKNDSDLLHILHQRICFPEADTSHQ